jgi:hypothetical protein
MAQMGRIGGPLLSDNLLRNGNNLTFDTGLLYLNVATKQVGVNTLGPAATLNVGNVGNISQATPGILNTINLIGTTTTEVGTFYISTNQIQNVSGNITFQPNQSSNPTVVTPRLSTANLYFSTNVLENTVTNDNINFNTSGTGTINFANGAGDVQVTVTGDLHATGSVTFDGNITLGTSTTDTIYFKAEVDSNLIPQVPTVLITPVSEQIETEDLQLFVTEDGQGLYTDAGNPYYVTNPVYNLGSSSQKWNNLYVNSFVNSSVNTSTVNFTNAEIGSTGNIVISGNQIQVGSNNVTLEGKGTGLVSINGTYFIDQNSIQNTTTGALTIASTGNGYTAFSGTSGIVIPVGTTSNYPSSPQTGTVRYNTELGYGEVYNGSGWYPVAGSNPVATQAEVTDAVWAWDLILG